MGVASLYSRTPGPCVQLKSGKTLFLVPGVAVLPFFQYCILKPGTSETGKINNFLYIVIFLCEKHEAKLAFVQLFIILRFSSETSDFIRDLQFGFGWVLKGETSEQHEAKTASVQFSYAFQLC